MFKFRDMTIGKKVGLGFGVMTLILMGVVLLTIQQVRTMEVITKRVVELRTPTAHASLMMLNGINHSLASLRGWIILGDPKFQTERSIAWEEQINPSLQLMHLLQRGVDLFCPGKSAFRLEFRISQENPPTQRSQRMVDAI